MNSKILMDITGLVSNKFSKKTISGIERVTHAYIEYYGANCVAAFCFMGRAYVFKDTSSKIIFQSLLENKKSFLSLFKLFIRLILSLNWNSFISEPAIFLTVGTGLKLKQSWLLKRNLHCICMLHDLFPFEYPEYVTSRWKIVAGERILNMLKNSSAIIINSADTFDRLKNYADRHQISLPMAKVALLGYNKNIEITKQLKYSQHTIFKNPYFVILGRILPRKNHMLLLNIWRKIVDLYGEHAPTLFIIGQRSYNQSRDVAYMLSDCKKIRDKVIEVGNFDDVQTTNYLLHAKALLFPSFAEGFGLPLIEALSIGTPAIVSDIPVFHEIAGDVPEYIDPLDAIKWIDVIMEYAKPDSKMRAAQIKRMYGYKAPTWDQHFKTVDQVIFEVQSKII